VSRNNPRKKKITPKLGFVDSLKQAVTGSNAHGAVSPRSSKRRGGANVNKALDTTDSKQNGAIPSDVCHGLGEEQYVNREYVSKGRRGTRIRTKREKKTVDCTGETGSLIFEDDPDNYTGIATNVLNDYLNVQYNIVFSMVPEDTTIEIQESIPLGEELPQRDIASELRAKGAVVIASTGSNFDHSFVRTTTVEENKTPPPGAPFRLPPGVTGSAGDISAMMNAKASAGPTVKTENVFIGDKNYYAITDMVVENYQSPTNANPLISSMFAGRMTILEPGGFSFNDDIRTISDRIGYKNVNNGRILYRIDISFSGYDPRTGSWKEVIDIDTRKETRIPFLTYYVVISKVEAKVTNTGTVYNIDFVPSGSAALRTEDFAVDAAKIFTGTSNTFGGFLDHVKVVLEESRRIDTTQSTNGPTGLLREYEFIAPESLRNTEFWSQEWAVSQAYVKPDKAGSLVGVGKNIDLLTVIQSALTDLPYVHELFIAKSSENDNNQFVRPRTHFTVRFNVVYGEKAEEVGDYKNLKIQVIIEPFISFKKGSYSARNVGEYTALEAQIRRVSQMTKIGAIVRKYDYLNTSGNTEVLDFSINLSAFFFEAMDSGQDFPGTKGTGTTTTAAQQEKNLRDKQYQAFSESIQTQIGTTLTGVTDRDNRFDTVLGGGKDLETAANNRLPPYDILGGGKGMAPDQNSYGAIQGEAASINSRKDKYMREFQDWLANDQMQIEDLQVRGDPLWLLSPYASADMNRLKKIGGLIKPNTDKCIFINIRAPKQKNYMDPDSYSTIKSEDKKGRNPNVMGGFYGVYSVESTFSGGSFTQKIQGYKMNHLNYVEEGLRFEDIISSTIKYKEAPGNSQPGVKGQVSDAFTQQKRSPLLGDSTTSTTASQSVNNPRTTANVLNRRDK